MVAVLGGEERCVPSKFEMRLSDTNPPRVARAPQSSPLRRAIPVARFRPNPQLCSMRRIRAKTYAV